MSTRYKNRRSITDALRREILKRDGHKCQKCGRIAKYGQDIHHIHHVADGGSDDPGNLITLCHSCHEEWHFITRRMTSLTFKMWLDIPDALAAIKFFAFVAPIGDETTMVQFRQQVMSAWHRIREEGWHPEDLIGDEDEDASEADAERADDDLADESVSDG